MNKKCRLSTSQSVLINVGTRRQECGRNAAASLSKEVTLGRKCSIKKCPEFKKVNVLISLQFSMNLIRLILIVILLIIVLYIF